MPDASQSGSTPTDPRGTATTAAGPTGSSFTTGARSGPIVSPRIAQWFEGRGISAATLQAGGVYSEGQGAAEVIVFPYRRRGGLVNRKYRGTGKTFRMDKGAELILWNIDCIDANPDHLYFVEGEPDALAFMEAGLWNVVSVPNGAPAVDKSEVPDDPEQDDTFRYLWNCREELKGRRYVIAGDMDPAGVRLRHALVARLGRANCDIVDWPDGIKDGNKYLEEVGPQQFREYVIASRRPYPIRGLWSWNDVTPTPPLDPRDIGIPGLRDHVKIAKRTMTVVTGIPNHGKSTLVKQIACEMIRNHHWNVTFGSFEDPIYATLMPELIHMFSGEPVTARGLGADRRAYAQQMLARRVSFIGDEGISEEPMDLPWLIDIVRDAKVRHGTDMLIIDPWNEIEHLWSGNKNETQYINEALRDIRKLASELDIAIVVVAHPTKVEDGKVPGLYNISGSAGWANKADVGMTVHQPEFAAGPGGPTAVHVKKIKRHVLGRRGIVALQFNKHTQRFEDPSAPPAVEQDSFEL
jgi:twinkle protein